MNLTCQASSAILALCLCADAVGSQLRAVALRGQAAPGASAGQTFIEFYSPTINNAGQVAFWGRLTMSWLGDDGIWSEAAGSLQLVARQNEQAPGTEAGATFDSFHESTPNVTSFRINESGNIAVYGKLSLGSGSVTNDNNEGVWSGGPGSFGLVARQSQLAPGLTASDHFGHPLNYPTFKDVVFNDAGQTAFRAQVFGPTSGPGAQSLGIWSQRGGSLNVVAMGTQQAPGTSPGTVFAGVHIPRINNSGAIVFPSWLAGAGVTSIDDSALFSDRSGTLALVAREGQQAAGLPAGIRYSGFDGTHYSLNNPNQIAFQTLLAGTGVTTANNSAIYLDTNGVAALVARKGSQVPGLASGVVYADFLAYNNAVVINDAGQVALLATLSGPGVTTSNETALFVGTPGNLQLVAREGDSVPGVPGATLTSPGFGGFTLNEAGQVAFKSGMSGPGINSANDFGLFATDPSGALVLIARENDVLESSPGVFSQLAGFDIHLGAGGGDGLPSSFNDWGSLAFAARFRDGSDAIYVSSAAAVPEPSSIALAGLGAACLFAATLRRRRKRA